MRLEMVQVVPSRSRPVVFGRSLTYKFGVAAGLSAVAFVGAPDDVLAEARRTFLRCLDYIVESPAYTHGRIEFGWNGPQPWVAQEYSGASSSLYAGKLLAPIALTRQGRFWTVSEHAASGVDGSFANQGPDLCQTARRSRRTL